MLLVGQVYSWFDEAIILFEKCFTLQMLHYWNKSQSHASQLSDHINNEMRSSVLRDKKSTVSHTL